MKFLKGPFLAVFLLTLNPLFSDPPKEMPLDWGTNPMGLYVTKFYPLGFSPKGHFAWAEYRDESDGRGAHTSFSVTIIDMVTDEVVYTLSYTGEDRSGGDPVVPFDQCWELKSGEIEGALAGFQVRRTDTVLTPLPFTLPGGKVFTIRSTHDEPDEDSPYSVRNLRGTASSSGRTKVIFTRDQGSLGLRPAGIILSPFGSRGAVIMIESSYAFEGSVDRRALVIGCHLTSGFSD